MSTKNMRSLKRCAVHQDIDVVDLVAERKLGKLVNIHREGLMIIGDVPLKADSLYQLSLRLSESIEGQGEIQVGVDCLWIRTSDDHNQFWAGCHIIDISAQNLKLIDSLV